MKFFSRLPFILVLFASLSACQSIDGKLPSDWLMKGRVIIKTPEQAQRLTVTWRQYQDKSEILLTGPLGASVARISPQGSVYSLDRPGEPKQTAESLESLVAMATSTYIPMSALVTVLNGDTSKLVAGDWTIMTTAFDSTGRPQKLDITSSATTIKLSIVEWK